MTKNTTKSASIVSYENVYGDGYKQIIKDLAEKETWYVEYVPMDETDSDFLEGYLVGSTLNVPTSYLEVQMPYESTEKFYSVSDIRRVQVSPEPRYQISCTFTREYIIT